MRATAIHFATTHPEDAMNFIEADILTGLENTIEPPPISRVKRDVLPADFLIFLDDEADEQRTKNRVLSEFINIDALPAPLRNFVRLQNEIAGREVGQMEAVTSPVGITCFTSPGSKLFEKKRKKEEWERFLFLLYMQFYNELLAKTWLKIEVTRTKLETVKKLLVAISEDAKFNKAADGLEDKIDTFLEEDLKVYEDRLQNTAAPPSENDLIQINKEIDEKVERLSISAKILGILSRGFLFSGFHIIQYLKNLSHRSRQNVKETLRDIDPVVFSPENLEKNFKTNDKKDKQDEKETEDEKETAGEKESETAKPASPPPQSQQPAPPSNDNPSVA